MKTNNILIGLLLALLSTGAVAVEKVTYLYSNGLGSPVYAADESGQPVWQETYRSYGERVGDLMPSDPTEAGYQKNQVWYTGHRQESDTGLVYAGARWYNPKVGRFYSIDPVGFVEGNPHSFNRYAYANNNPYRFVDPDGRAPELAFDLQVAGVSVGEAAALRRAHGTGTAMGLGIAVGVLTPGPEDVALSMFLASKAGQGLGRAAGAAVKYVKDTYRYWQAVRKQRKATMAWGRNAKGHLIKHRDVLGFGETTAQEAQRFLPQLKESALELLRRADPRLTKVGRWHGHHNARFYVSDGKMIVTEADGTYITAIDKTSNNWYQEATSAWD